MSRTIAAKIFNQADLIKIWTGNYQTVLPFTMQDFSIGALMPAVLYMLRRGHRRGQGQFFKVFATKEGGKPTSESVASILAASPEFEGFESDTGRVLLADLLLAFLVENRRRSPEHTEQIQRVLSSHYFSSWIDLPESVANLRNVPEFLIGALAWQGERNQITPGDRRHLVKVGVPLESNAFLRPFSAGVSSADTSSLTADKFNETAIGVDQLLAVRLALQCGAAPEKARGKGEASPIMNQWPLAIRAAKRSGEDIRTFVLAYGETMPRAALNQMLESGIGLNLLNVLLSTAKMLEHWAEKYTLAEESPCPVLVDMAQGGDLEIREAAERSMDSVRRTLAVVPRILMRMRLVELELASSEIPQNQRPDKSPDPSAWVAFLGDIASGSHEESRDFEKSFRKYSNQLREILQEEGGFDASLGILENDQDGRKAGERLAEALTILMGPKNTTEKINKFLADIVMADQVNGLARQRRVQRKDHWGSRKSVDLLSLSFSNTSLEFLVHRHLRRPTKGQKPAPLSLPDFLKRLREQYGFLIDQAPPGLEVPNEVLRRNRFILERRLRDLGLLHGVNDAERMKRLQSRFEADESPVADNRQEAAE